MFMIEANGSNQVNEVFFQEYFVYITSPVSTKKNDEEQLQRMAEFVCRANEGLKNGNFEWSYKYKILRYKCYMNCNGAIPSMGMVKDSIYYPASAFNAYKEGLLQILTTDVPVVDVIEQCERVWMPPEGSVDEEKESNERIMGILREFQDTGDKEESAERLLEMLQDGKTSSEEETSTDFDD